MCNDEQEASYRKGELETFTALQSQFTSLKTSLAFEQRKLAAVAVVIKGNWNSALNYFPANRNVTL